MVVLSTVSQAALITLLDRGRPVVTGYELFQLVWDIYTSPDKYPIKIRKKVSAPGYDQFNRVITELAQERHIRADADFDGSHTVSTKTQVFRVNEIPDMPAEDIACLVDPFCYVAFISALQRYGLSVRQPNFLSIATPASSTWATSRDEKLYQDYGFIPSSRNLDYFRRLERIEFHSKIRERKIDVHRIKHKYETQTAEDSYYRIITLGDLFVQTLVYPELCGGILHVLDIWEEHFETFTDQIIKSVDRFHMPIVKVRAGYIISERLDIKNDTVISWKSFAQRGGSRKLDPNAEYGSSWSEDWMIATNV